MTGVDLIIDDTPEAITLSSFDPVRREVARIALERLISDGRIHPARIEEMVEKARREVDATIKQEGERAIIEAGVNGIHPELVKLLAAALPHQLWTKCTESLSGGGLPFRYDRFRAGLRSHHRPPGRFAA